MILQEQVLVVLMVLLLLLCITATTTTTAFVPSVSSSFSCRNGHCFSSTSTSSSRTILLWNSNINGDNNDNDIDIPSQITTNALKQLYPKLIEHKQKYGNPNIPLGNTAGRQCNAIRRMHIQNKLTIEEVELLEKMGFLFHNLEDVYEYADFDDMYERLLKYKEEHGDLAVPKKYVHDPELGAWVTGIRRLGKERIDMNHMKQLDSIDFLWISTRKCGSQFMKEYRTIQIRIQNQGLDKVIKEEGIQKFLRAQKEALKRQTLSNTRQEYMTSLFGKEWYKKDYSSTKTTSVPK